MIEEKETGQVYGIIDPDYGRMYTMIRKLAWEEGYAIGLHGSFTRDLDLIAVPWAERRCDAEHLVRRILAATGLNSLPSNPGKKPHGRLVWTLLFPEFGDPRFIDLSVIAIPKQNVVDAESGEAVTMPQVLSHIPRSIPVTEKFLNNHKVPDGVSTELSEDLI